MVWILECGVQSGLISCTKFNCIIKVAVTYKEAFPFSNLQLLLVPVSEILNSRNFLLSLELSHFTILSIK